MMVVGVCSGMQEDRIGEQSEERAEKGAENGETCNREV